MYEVATDPYCYSGTDVLRNKLDIRDGATLAAYEAEISRQRSMEPLPRGRGSLTHYRAIHRHLFQDVYPWAGRSRTVRLHKGDSTFAYPEHLADAATILFGELRKGGYLAKRSPQDFCEAAAHFLAELNALHLFRDGNGRCQLIFLALLADSAGHPLDIADRLDPDAFLQAMIASFRGDESSLVREIGRLAGV